MDVHAASDQLGVGSYCQNSGCFKHWRPVITIQGAWRSDVSPILPLYPTNHSKKLDLEWPSSIPKTGNNSFAIISSCNCSWLIILFSYFSVNFDLVNFLLRYHIKLSSIWPETTKLKTSCWQTLSIDGNHRVKEPVRQSSGETYQGIPSVAENDPEMKQTGQDAEMSHLTHLVVVPFFLKTYSINNT